jgi:hypothetical protein
MYEANQKFLRPMIEESAKKYANEKKMDTQCMKS